LIGLVATTPVAGGSSAIACSGMLSDRPATLLAPRKVIGNLEVLQLPRWRRLKEVYLERAFGLAVSAVPEQGVKLTTRAAAGRWRSKRSHF